VAINATTVLPGEYELVLESFNSINVLEAPLKTDLVKIVVTESEIVLDFFGQLPTFVGDL